MDGQSDLHQADASGREVLNLYALVCSQPETRGTEGPQAKPHRMGIQIGTGADYGALVG